MRLDVLSERTAASSQVLMYHGTSTGVLRRILKTGLVPHPEDRSYGTDEWELASHGGIYLTTDIQNAYSYAARAATEWSAEPVILTIMVVEKTAIPDEDALRHWFGQALASEKLLGRREQIEIAKSDDPMSIYADDSRVLRVLEKFHQYASGGNRHLPLKLDLLRRLFETHLLVEFGNGDPADLDNYRKAVEAVSRHYRAMARRHHPAANPRVHTLRLMSPIGFKGRNRIVGIHRLDIDWNQQDGVYLEDIETLWGSPLGQDEVSLLADAVELYVS